ncbi:VOC family protein [Lipomyces arxii]|uniref:VOC family protein n=1 Tax=Lipomyces arxii TaxID=56418 RepID=UPI0034D00F14
MTGISHISIYVCDFARSRTIYVPLMKALGYKIAFERETVCFSGPEGTSDFTIGICSVPNKINGHTHVALDADSQELVGKFYEAAITAGAVDHGAPGPRPNYSPTYYAAFIKDPDGNVTEAVTNSSS